MSNDIQPHDVVATTGWLKMGISARKGVDACTVTGGMILPEGLESVLQMNSSTPGAVDLSCFLLLIQLPLIPHHRA